MAESFFVKFVRSRPPHEGTHARERACRGRIVLPVRGFNPQPEEGWEVEEVGQTRRGTVLVRPISGPYKVLEYEARGLAGAPKIVSEIPPEGEASARVPGGSGQRSFQVVFYFYRPEQIAEFEARHAGDAEASRKAWENAEREANSRLRVAGFKVHERPGGRAWSEVSSPHLAGRWTLLPQGEYQFVLAGCTSRLSLDKFIQRYGGVAEAG